MNNNPYDVMFQDEYQLVNEQINRKLESAENIFQHTAFYPQSYGLSNRIISVIKETLFRMWDKCFNEMEENGENL